MKKCKKIVAILNGKGGLIEKLLDRREGRILRNIESAIAYGEDKMDALAEKKEKLLQSLVDVAGAEQTAACSEVLNNIIDTVKEYRGFEESVAILKDLQVELNTEVEVVEKEEEKK